jgi:hypothetical protein
MEMCSRRATLDSLRPYHDAISSIWNPVRASKLRGFAAMLAEVESFANFSGRGPLLAEIAGNFESGILLKRVQALLFGNAIRRFQVHLWLARADGVW